MRVPIRAAGAPSVMVTGTVNGALSRPGASETAVKWLLLIAGCAIALYLPVHFTRHPYRVNAFIPNLLGVVGGGMMLCGALFYILRKRVRAMKNLGHMKYWLNAHIMFCLYGPLLVLYHSGLSVKALNSGVALYTMLVVLFSGVAGRYIYRHFQLTLSGERASLKEMRGEVDGLIQEVTARFPDAGAMVQEAAGLFAPKPRQQPVGSLESLILMIRLDWSARRLTARIGRQLRSGGRALQSLTQRDRQAIEDGLRRMIGLEKNIAALEATTKLFSLWHALHVPLIWILVVTVILHMVAISLL
ncbi:MAG: hypothetical protein HY208_02560 [Nitrospirae bacterium]|nr:hypothetical protein [Nitrospirota bacterium]